jgi:hypothetical protein
VFDAGKALFFDGRQRHAFCDDSRGAVVESGINSECDHRRSVSPIVLRDEQRPFARVVHCLGFLYFLGQADSRPANAAPATVQGRRSPLA